VICPNCKHQTSHLKILPNGNTICHNCGGYAESGGVRTDKILTRNSDRVRDQQHQHEGDMITPYVWDKATDKAVVNHDFVELYPEQAAVTFTKDELKAAGHGRLLERVKEADPDTSDVEFSGDEKQAIKGVIDG
jgi:hypothetical protein